MMAMPTRVVLATRNAKKCDELRRILDLVGVSCEVKSLSDFPHYSEDIPETAPDFEGNALAKATAVHQATGWPAIADDSGLCVDALNGMPGVLSARWAGTRDDGDNLQLVLAQLIDVPTARRGAQFVAAVAYVDGNRDPLIVRGEMSGTITTATAGVGGFGYDPIFIAQGQVQTNAELSSAEKDAISHRGRALRALIDALRSS